MIDHHRQKVLVGRVKAKMEAEKRTFGTLKNQMLVDSFEEEREKRRLFLSFSKEKGRRGDYFSVSKECIAISEFCIRDYLS